MKKIAVLACVLASVLLLASCTVTNSSYAQVTLDEVSGIKVTAENATSDQGTTTAGGVVVKDGDVVVISPFLSKGSIHVTITSTDGKTTVYDDDADGQVMFTVPAEPGEYDVKTTPDNATGEMTVFAQSQDELAAQDASLAETLDEALGSEEAEKVLEEMKK